MKKINSLKQEQLSGGICISFPNENIPGNDDTACFVSTAGFVP